MSLRGQRVEQFADNLKNSNKNLINKNGLTISEWITFLKMKSNVTCVRNTPGRSIDGTQCRRCDAEKESLGHVLGFCSRGELIHNQRHNGIPEILAKGLIEKGCKVFQEVHCVEEQGSNRRVYIIIYNEKTRQEYILDPTVRFEYGDSTEQSLLVDTEKREIYEPCVFYFKEKYRLKNIVVIGLYIGARGSLSKCFQEFRFKFNLPVKIIGRNWIVCSWRIHPDL